jgi:hypothetical protein
VALGYQHTHEPLPDPRQLVPDLPNGVCRILAKGASKEPDKRYQSAAEMQEELEALLASPADSLLYGGLLDLDASQLQSLPKLPDSLQPEPLGPDPLGYGQQLTPSARYSGERAGVRGARLWTLAAVRRASEGMGRIPGWRVGLGLAVAGALVLGLTLRTGSGTVAIELSDPEAQGEVRIDGERIDIAELKEPLQLKAGVHELVVAPCHPVPCVQQSSRTGLLPDPLAPHQFALSGRSGLTSGLNSHGPISVGGWNAPMMLVLVSVARMGFLPWKTNSPSSLTSKRTF